MTFELTDEQMRALNWARNQSFDSVAARHAKKCAEAFDVLRKATATMFTQEEVEVAISGAVKLHVAGVDPTAQAGVTNKTQEDQAAGWVEVCKLLTYHNKHWLQHHGSGIDAAAAEIKRLQTFERPGKPPGPMPPWARLLLECRDALPLISMTAARLHRVDMKLADRIAEMLKPWEVPPETPGAL